jgi:hypothetical protein
VNQWVYPQTYRSDALEAPIINDVKRDSTIIFDDVAKLRELP